MAKKPGTRPPTADYVSALYELRQNEGDESKLRTGIADMRLLTDMEHAVEIPEQYRAITKEVRTPFTRDTWLRVTAALTEKNPVAHVEPRDDTSAMRQSANIAERWTEAAVDQMNAALGRNVTYDSVKALVRDTESVVKLVHRPDSWANFPKRLPGEGATDVSARRESFKKSAPLPFAWREVDRLSMLFGDGEFGDDWALEYGEYPTPYLANRYEMDEIPDAPEFILGGKPKPEGTLITASGRAVKMEYWDADWWHVTINGHDAPGFPRPSPYSPHLPYFRAIAPEPVLVALKYLVPTLDALLTMKLNWSYLGAYPNPVLEPVISEATIPDLGEDGTAPAFKWTPGKLIMPPYGYKFGFVSPPPVGEDLNQLITILRGLIDVAGIPSVFRGIGGADQAGYAINQLIAAANLTYKVLSKVAQAQLQGAAAFLWWLVNYRIRQTVYVLEMPEFSEDTGRPKGESAWLGLAPGGEASRNVAAFDHLAKLVYSFRPVLPTDEQARAMIAMQLTNAERPLWSVRHALEKMQEEDPESIIDDMKVERYMEDPPIRDAILQNAMRKARMGPYAPTNAASKLVRPDGSPLIPEAAVAAGTFPPGQMAAGLPGIPGATQPVVPSPPGAPPIVMGGQGVGAFPGQPGGVPLYRKVQV